MECIPQRSRGGGGGEKKKERECTPQGPGGGGGMQKDKHYSINPYNEGNVQKEREKWMKEVKEALNLTSINST